LRTKVRPARASTTKSSLTGRILFFRKITGFAGRIRLAVKVIKVNPTGLAGMMDIVVAVRSSKTVAFELLTLACYAPAAA
jgi:hypothetical protein